MTKKSAVPKGQTSFAKNFVAEDVKIIDVNNLGNGVAKIDGKTVFVKGAVTGDVCDIVIIKDASDYAVAAIKCLKKGSPHRVPAGCPVYKRCGGCVYRQIDYNFELSQKAAQVKYAFLKEGLSPTIDDILFDKEDGYRNKVQYPVSYDRKIGYYAQRTHEIVQVRSCCLQDKRFEPLLDEIAIFLDDHDICGYDETKGVGVIRHICMRAANEGISLCLVINSDDLPYRREFIDTITSRCPDVLSISLSVNKSRTNVILGEGAKIIWGKESLTDTLCGLKFEISPMSFYQVNRNMAEKLYGKAAEYADLKNGQTLVDLFCGVGSIGLSMIKDKPSSKLIGIEIIPDAVENARRNAEINGIKNASFTCGDANAKEVADADVIVIDPPRKGCDPALALRIADSSCSRVVYVSCNPTTLARDCKRFVEHGFLIEKVTPADLFPRTGHVETVCLLSRIKTQKE